MIFDLADVATDPGPLDPVHIPDAVPDEASTDEDVPVTTSVLANDPGLADAPIVVTIPSPPAHGTAVVEPDGRVTYTPAPNWNGTDAYSYEVTDADGESDTATVTITVAPVNDAPVAMPDSATGYAGVDATGIAVLANDADVDGDALSVSAVTQGTNGGTVTIRPGGTVAYLPPTPQFEGTDSFTYTVSDGALSDSATVTVTIGPPVDSDRDGLPDWVEDDDGDGTVDPGETDPLDPDSDHDGLLDGIEDGNHNGTVDPGETDPLDPDSDDDGLLDGIEDADHDGTFDPGETESARSGHGRRRPPRRDRGRGPRRHVRSGRDESAGSGQRRRRPPRRDRGRGPRRHGRSGRDESAGSGHRRRRPPRRGRGCG